MKQLLLIATLLLSGCAVSDFGRASSGGAVYHYSSIKADGSRCELKITSARTVSGGNIKIDENCQLVSEADDAGGAKEALNKIGEIISEVMP